MHRFFTWYKNIYSFSAVKMCFNWWRIWFPWFTYYVKLRVKLWDFFFFWGKIIIDIDYWSKSFTTTLPLSPGRIFLNYNRCSLYCVETLASSICYAQIFDQMFNYFLTWVPNSWLIPLFLIKEITKNKI